MNTQIKRLITMLTIVVALVSIPFIAMQFTDEVKWTTSDFLIMGVVLLSIGLAYEFIGRRSQKTLYRVAFGIGLLGAFLLFWVNGAVGIIGNEGQPANLLYGVVFVVGFVGSFLVRFEARGMDRTMFAAASVQMLVPVTALLIWPPPMTSWSPSIFGVFLLSAFFAMLFIISGILFKKASISN